MIKSPVVLTAWQALLMQRRFLIESEDLTSFVDERARGVCFHGGHLNFAPGNRIIRKFRLL